MSKYVLNPTTFRLEEVSLRGVDIEHPTEHPTTTPQQPPQQTDEMGLDKAARDMANEVEEVVDAARESLERAYDYCASALSSVEAPVVLERKDDTRHIAAKYGIVENRQETPIPPKKRQPGEGSWLESIYQSDPSDLWDLIT